jgi:uncharacterized DUF497 family protein
MDARRSYESLNRVLTLYIYCDNFGSKKITWDERKNAVLKKSRGLAFEDILEALARDGPLWIREHPRKEKYPSQRLLAVLIDGYVFIVPHEVTHDEIIFKTSYPSRRATNELREREENKDDQSPE